MNEKSRLLQRAVDAAIHGIYVTDPKGVFQLVNPGICRITGYGSEELLNRKISLLCSGQMAPDYYQRLWQTILAGDTWEEEIINRRRDGSLYWAHQIISPVTDDAGRIQNFVGIQNDITERKEMEQELRYLSEMDVLTGIANRGKIREELEREIARAVRHGQSLSMLMIDIDHFKAINDQFGNETGDAVLRAIATTTEAVLRPSDRLGRWGGEEFVIILPETGLEGAKTLAERVLHAVRQSRAIPDYRITVSIGLAAFQQIGPESGWVDSLIRRADEQMYKAKGAGRDQSRAPDQES